MKLGHYKIWPDNCCKTWSGICCKGWPKNYCKVWFKKLQKLAQKCCKESKCDQYLLWILRTVSIGYNFDWNFGLEIVAEFGREKFGREKFGREKFGQKMLFNTIGKKIGKFEPVSLWNINRSFNLLFRGCLSKCRSGGFNLLLGGLGRSEPRGLP